MSIIKVINGEKVVVANKSITDHSQLTGREAYGAHPISAIRKLPEKLHDLKQENEATRQSVLGIETAIDTNRAGIAAEIEARTSEIERVENTTKTINIVEDTENKGKLLFTNYDGETTAIQGGFLPDEDTITLVNNEMSLKQIYTDGTMSGKGTSEDPLTAVAISDGTTKYTPGNIKTAVDNINIKLDEIDNQNENQDNRIYTLETITNGIGGYLNSYDFKANPTQEALTAYAMQDVNASNQSEIFNGTKVINLYDNHVWMLTNTPNSEPAVFSWQDLGEQPSISVATDTTFGVVKSSYEDLQGNIDVNGNITINNLDLKIRELDQISETYVKNTDLDDAIKTSLTANTIELSDSEKTAAQNYIGALAKPANPTRNSVVTINGSGTVATTQLVHESATSWTVPCRDDKGCIKVAEPQTDLDAANKAYVDSKIPKITAELLEDGSYSLNIISGV